MNSNLVDFIDYEEDFRQDFFPKLEIEIEIGNQKPFEKFEDDFFEDPFQQNLNPPDLDRLDSNIFSSIFQSESQQTSLNHQTSDSDKQQTLQTIREKKEELSTTSDDASTNHPLADPISSKSRRIMKREKAKQRNQQNKPKLTEDAILSGDIPAKFIPEGFNANLDERSKKKMLQMIRNRISAQNSRDRKRNLIDQLENQQRVLCDENLRLKGRVRQLEQENSSLQKENQEYKKALGNVYPLGKNQNNAFPTEIFDIPFDLQSPNPSTESPNLGINSSPVLRKVLRSGGFMKYSLALATIFAVLMFNGMNSPINQQATPIEMISNVPQQPIFQVPAPRVNNHATRILEDTSKLEPEMAGSNSQSLILKMEEEVSGKQPCISTDLNEFPFISQLNNLQQNFNEKYMSKFFSQLKIVDPTLLNNNYQQSFNMNILPEEKTTLDLNFPSYLRASRRQLPDYSKPKDINQTQIVPFIGDNTKLPVMKGENFSSLFCPSGFEFQGQEDNSFVKIEDDMSTSTPQKKLRVIDSEWLQLFVPKNSISIAKVTEQDNLFINPAQNDPNDDSTILEIWCKVFFIRELPSGF